MVTIRLAVPDDAADIARVHILGWQTTYRGIIPDAYLESFSFDERTRRWDRLLHDNSRQEFVYVAETDGGVVGFASGGPNRTPELSAFSGELWSIYLLNSYQGQGIGRQLFMQIVARLRADGHESMLLWVLRDNPARRFYDRLGGQVIKDGSFEVSGAQIPEVAYGWPALASLHR